MTQKFTCPHCSRSLNPPDRLLGHTVNCPSCKEKITLPRTAIQQHSNMTSNAINTHQKSSDGLIASGYFCSLIALLLFPPGFGIAGLAIGIINLTKGSIGHGIAQIVLSITCAVFGMIIGVATSV